MRKMNETDMKYYREEVARINKRIERKQTLEHGFKFIIFTPLSIALKFMAFALKIIGGISSIAIPFGLYFLIKIIVQLCNRTPFSEINDGMYVIMFLLCPFAIFLLMFICENLSEYLRRKTRVIRYSNL